MKNKAVRQIIASAVILTVVCILCRLLFFRTYTVYVPLHGTMTWEKPQEAPPAEDFSLEMSMDNPDIVQVEPLEIKGGYARITVRPEKQGSVWMDITDEKHEDYNYLVGLKVGPFGTIYDRATGGFSGDRIVLAAVTLFFLAVSLITLRAALEAKGPAFYSYYSIFYVGMFLFSFSTFVALLLVTLHFIMRPVEYFMFNAYSSIRSTPGIFMTITFPLVFAFGVAMIISNIALLRHERPRVQNMLGILLGGLLITGELAGLWLINRNFAGSEWEYRVFNTMNNVYAAAFSYFECILAGSVICGLKAAKHVPPYDRDYIVILGCYFRKDGSLPPLLKGRVDRAVEFFKQQKEKTGKEAVLIPSGGQGPNESMSESEAMGRYLISCGIPERLIRREDRSRNTYQNMEFSKAMIDREQPEARVAFSTTNYHVFRSGVWAGLAGLPAEGMGSRTKWWYWPNAFMRECIGLLQNRLKQEIVLLVLFVLIFGGLSITLL